MRSAPGCKSVCGADPLCHGRGFGLPDSRRPARCDGRCVDLGQGDRCGQRTRQTHASGRHRHISVAAARPSSAQSGDQCTGALRRSCGIATFPSPLAVVAAVLTRKHAVRGLLAACVWVCMGSLDTPAAMAAEPAFDIRVLDAALTNARVTAVPSGSLDDKFTALTGTKLRNRRGAFWVKLRSIDQFTPTDLPLAGIPVLVMHGGRQTQGELFAARDGSAVSLPQATQLPGFRGTQDTVFTLIEGLTAGQSLYVHINVPGSDSEPVSFASSTLDRTLARGAEHARMIALVFGALMAVALTALLIWFVLKDQ